MRRRLLATLGAAASLAAASLGLAAAAGPAAAAPVTQFGPVPVSDDCYFKAGATHNNCFYGGIGGMTFHNSKHIVRVGETMSVSMTSAWDSFLGQNGPVIRTVTSALDPEGHFEVVGDACGSLFFFSTSQHCTLKAKTPTGGWRTHGYVLSINGSRPYEAGDYFGVVGPDEYEISGLLRKYDKKSKKQLPFPGVGVIVEQISGDGEKYETTSNQDGRYSVLVKEGHWRVRTDDRSLCHDTSTGSGCSRQPETTTGGDREINFSAPLPVKISGRVTTGDDSPVKDAKIRASVDGADPIEVYSDATGNYEFDDIQPGDSVTLDSPDGDVCPVIGTDKPAVGDNGRCTDPTVTLTPQADVTQDFARPDCAAAIDFETSMKAKADCFKVLAPEKWSTDQPFRMNGIDFTPVGEVAFDKTTHTVDFGTAIAAMTLPVKVGGEDRWVPVGAMPAGFAITFDTATTKVAFTGDVKTPTFRSFGRFPLSGAYGIEMTAGASALSIGVTMPADPFKQYAFTGDDSEAKVGATVKVNTDNELGARGAEVSLANEGNKLFRNPLFQLKEAKLGYDFADDLWTIGGKVEPAFLNKNPVGDTSFDNSAKELEGSLTTKGIPGFGGSFVSLSAGLGNINKPIDGPLFLQRASMKLPLSLVTSNAPNSFEAGLGLSLGPHGDGLKEGGIPVIPQELVSLDGKFAVAWTNLSDTVANDLSISGDVDAKLWDIPIGNVGASIYPASGLAGGHITAQLVDPFGGTIFSMIAKGQLWIDPRTGKQGAVYLEGSGTQKLLGVGYAGDVVITGPGPVVAAFCGEVFGHRFGLTYTFDSGKHDEGLGCDLSAYRATKPQATVAPKAARAKANRAERLALRRAAAAPGKKTQTFRAKGTEELLSFQVGAADPKATGAPVLKLRGPGVSITSDAAKGTKTAKAATFPNTGSHVVTFLVNKPKKGKYTVSSVGKGGPLLSAPKFAALLPDPQVDAQLDADVCSPKVTWNATGISGQSLRLVQTTASGATVVSGESASGKGSLPFTPLPGAGKTAVALQVVNQGTVRKTIDVGTFTSGVADTLPGPASVTVKQGRSTGKGKKKKTQTSVVSWTKVCGAESYSVVTKAGKSTSKPAVVSGTTVTLPTPKGKGATVTVTALGRGAAAGGSTLVPLG